MSTQQIWNGYMRSYDHLTEVDDYRRNLRDVMGQVRPRAGMAILDAGSGTGNLSIPLKAKGADVVAFDFSTSALRIHRAKDPDAKLVQGSLEEPLEFTSNAFDTVCCTSVLTALTRSGCELALREFHRVLKTGGKLVATVPAPEARVGNLVRMYWRSASGRYGRVRGALHLTLGLPSLVRILHYNRKISRLPDWQGFHMFKEKELGGLLVEAGFESIHIRRTYGGCFLLAVAMK